MLYDEFLFIVKFIIKGLLLNDFNLGWKRGFIYNEFFFYLGLLGR